MKGNNNKSKWYEEMGELKFLIPILILVSIGLPFLFTWISPCISKIVLKLLGRTIIGNKNGWLGFYGGFFGGIISLVGIWYQITRKEKQDKLEKFSGLKKYLSYSFEKNIELSEKEDLIYLFQSFINYVEEFKNTPERNENNYKKLYLPSSNFIEDNLKNLMESNDLNGKLLLDTIEEIKYFNINIESFNKNRIELGGVFYKINNVVSKFPEGISKNKIITSIKIIKHLSHFINCYNQWDLIGKDLKILNESLGEKIKQDFKNLKYFNNGLFPSKDFSELKEKFENLKFNERNIQTSIELNNIFIEILKDLVMRLSGVILAVEQFDNEIVLESDNLSKELYNSILLDKHLNGYLSKLLEKIKSISKKLGSE